MSEVVRVCELAEQLRGVSYGKSDASSTPRPGYLPVLRAGNITEDGLTFDDLVFVPAERISAKQKVRRNDVVIAASSGSLDVVGKAARALNDYEGGFGAFCKVLRPGPDVDPAYFAHFFRTQQYRRKVSALAAGVNINNLRNEHLNEIQIPIPSLPEQRQIAAILDKADALRAKRRAALAQLDTLTQSIFLDMFGDPAVNGWCMTTIDGVAAETDGAIRTGPFGSQLLHSEFTEEGIAVLGIDNAVENEFRWGRRRFINEGKYRQLSRYTVHAGDVLITNGYLRAMCDRARRHSPSCQHEASLLYHARPHKVPPGVPPRVLPSAPDRSSLSRAEGEGGDHGGTEYGNHSRHAYPTGAD